MKGKDMRSLKTLYAAGMAALVVTGSAGLASAADMMAPPPPPPLAPAPAPLEVGGGFYLRGDIGAGIQSHQSPVHLPAAARYSLLSTRVSDIGFIGVGAGYAFNSWLRADVTAEYRLTSHMRNVELDNNNTPLNGADDGINVTTGKVRAIVGLANVYADLGTWNRVTPFIGLGVGFANLSATNFHDVGFAGHIGGAGSAPDRTKTNLAWAVHAGAAFDVTSNLKLVAGYRYLNMGKFASGSINCGAVVACYSVNMKNYDSHDVKVGFRYTFSEAMAPLYAPGPLVRKY